jgi:hypothetical protein
MLPRPGSKRPRREPDRPLSLIKLEFNDLDNVHT